MYINSYNNGYAWSDNTLKGIRSVLPMDIQNLNFQVEYLDAKRYETQAMKAALFAYFKAKFRNSRFDVIITSDNNALEFITEYRDKLFPGVPVVFCGVNDFHPNMLEGQDPNYRNRGKPWPLKRTWPSCSACTPIPGKCW